MRSPHLGAVVSGYSGPGTTSGDTATDAGGPEPPADASTPGRPMASRYRNAAPIWTDPAVSEVLPQLHSTAVLAAVRSATVGMPVERAACAPFTAGRWAFSHNGKIADWQRVLTEVAAEFGSPPLLAAEARTDSAALWVILHGLLENSLMPVESASATAGLSQPTESEDTTTAWRRSESSTRPDALAAGSGGTEGPDPAEALRRLLLAVLDRDPAARLNLLLGDGETLWATTRHHSLSVLVTDEFAVASSEPYDDDPRWRAVPDRQLVTLRPGLLSVVPLDPDATG
ncbi:ergothioneine biosynthesis protein EgtC [Nocardia sp. BMG111209]|uniref:ergothioneine biosynthesis protein EgtC n=1 Tax=Nocardia sp. BMG111209 TaxID=1160137 RepID=UPI00350EFB78